MKTTDTNPAELAAKEVLAQTPQPLQPENVPVPGGGSWRWNAEATSPADAWLAN